MGVIATSVAEPGRITNALQFSTTTGSSPTTQVPVFSGTFPRHALNPAPAIATLATNLRAASKRSITTHHPSTIVVPLLQAPSLLRRS